MAYILRVNGTKEQLPKGILSLEVLQKAVGGYVETIPTKDGKVMVLNEEGKLHGLPVNTVACQMTRGIIAHDDLIVGDVVICEETGDGDLK